VDREVSIGDYVLSGGELAAMVVIEAVARLVPGVVGNPESLSEESFGGGGLLEYPHYTRPEEFRGMRVPEILLSGDHAKIRAWREAEARERTERRRPDLGASRRKR
jgi:tRNA (guanine37-N1)-methyltransferase